MECNKDEALRAKELAEKKMQTNDFLGAKKVALKAERLYPQLENLSQLLSVCNVHISAQSCIMGLEKDWYGILQVDVMADELTIKKQYRRLALLLHPDKNKFPGAEAAFKLIGEANVVLSDKGKRAVYDSRYRVFSKAISGKQSSHQAYQNPSFRQTVPNGFSFQSTNQQTQPTSSAGPQAFWTGCPYCYAKYQYLRSYVNKTLLCQKCSKHFLACDLGSQGANLGTTGSHFGSQNVNMNQPYQQKEVPNQRTTKTAADRDGVTSDQSGSQQGPNSTTMGSQPEQRRESMTKGKGKDRKRDKDIGGMKEEAAVPKGNKTSKKRSRKQTDESSESVDASSSTDPEVVDLDSDSEPYTGLGVGQDCVGQDGVGQDGFGPRRSSRLRQHVSYKEGASDDECDYASSRKKVRAKQSAGDDASKQQHAVHANDLKNSDSAGSHGNSHAETAQNGTTPNKGSNKNRDANIGGVDSDSDSDSELHDDEDDCPEPVAYDCPEPEFNDFDKHRQKDCFAVDQVWACYDTADGMPRFYCQIKKVSVSPEFVVSYIWFEAHPEDQGGVEWVEADLPASCGRFKRGTSDKTNEILMFSHQMQCEKTKKGTFMLPREGETWALFKDWDIGWSSDPEKHQKYRYEVVEVLSDFVKDDGIEVNYLDKVSGFVSLFQPTSQTKVGPFFVKPNELYKFSHRIPSFRMNGTEKEGVPVGSFELDPASLPLNPDDLWCPGMVEEDIRGAKSESGCNVSCAVPSDIGPNENVTTPRKGKAASDGDSFKIRRSPRGVNIGEE